MKIKVELELGSLLKIVGFTEKKEEALTKWRWGCGSLMRGSTCDVTFIKGMYTVHRKRWLFDEEGVVITDDSETFETLEKDGQKVWEKVLEVIEKRW